MSLALPVVWANYGHNRKLLSPPTEATIPCGTAGGFEGGGGGQRAHYLRLVYLKFQIGDNC